MQTPLGSCGLPACPGAASPACLPFTGCRAAAWCCKSREKNRQEDRGPLGRKSGAWEQLGDAARAQAGEAPVLGKGSSWDRSPPGSAHSWRKRHFWGQTSAWEKFQGCLWSAAVAELLGPRASAMVLGSGGSLWAWEGILMTCKCAKLQAGCWEQSRRILWVQPWFEAQALLSLGQAVP